MSPQRKLSDMTSDHFLGNYFNICSNTGSIRDDPYWTSKVNSLKLIEPSSINKGYYLTLSFKITAFKDLTRHVLNSMTGHISLPMILQKIMQVCL
jgi:hypothetical protein